MWVPPIQIQFRFTPESADLRSSDLGSAIIKHINEMEENPEILTEIFAKIQMRIYSCKIDMSDKK